MSFIPDDDEPTIVPIRLRGGPRSAPGITGLGIGNTLPPGTRLDEFEITGLVGEGGFGIVYLAHDHILGRDVALKEYLPSALAARGESLTVVVRSARFEEPFDVGLRSFINEARLLARFDHPSLVKVYRFWGANNTAYMAMPFYAGITLKMLLKRKGQPPEEAWLKDLLRPLLDALELLHNDQVFHRDIAPDNILMLDEGRPVLLDFGAARRVIGDLTHELTAILKPGYAPIEQYAESASMKQGPWTDVYALASVMYFAIMGKAPEPSAARVIADPLVPLETVAADRYSPQFLRAIDRALSVNPQDRPQCVAELRTLLGLGDRRRQVRRTIDPRAAPDGPPITRLPPAAPNPPQSEVPPQFVDGAMDHETSEAVQPSLRAVGARPAQKARLRPLAVLVATLLVLIGAPATYLLFRAEAPRKETPTDSQPAQAPQASSGPSQGPPTEPRASAQPPTRLRFSAELMLSQVIQGSDRARRVTVTAEQVPVRAGPAAVRFSVGAPNAGYLYVLMLGTREDDFELVFPNALETNNRLDAGIARTLPGAQWSWPARGPAGRSRFVAIVSDTPRDFSALATQSDGPFRRFPLELGARMYRDYTGSTPLYAGEARCEGSNVPCSHAYGAAMFSLEQADADLAGGEPPKSTGKTTASREESTGARTKPSTKITETPECADILQRASLGEALSAKDQATLREDCR